MVIRYLIVNHDFFVSFIECSIIFLSFGHKDGRARALNLDSEIGSCSQYFECLNGVKTSDEPITCDSEQPYFDAQTGNCDASIDVCFQCSHSSNYELYAVPDAPIQFIRCFKQKPLLVACPDNMEFDNRIQQCNAKRLCPNKILNGRQCMTGGPHYEIDTNDPSV